MNLQLLEIYWWTIVAGVLAAAALAVWGAQLAARDRSMQTLCIGQGAMLGVLVGIGIITFADASYLVVLPFGLALLLSIGIGWIGVWIERSRCSNPATWFAALFAGLLALNYLVSAVFPGLESHMAQVFFGDLATMSEQGAWLTVLGSSFMLVVLVGAWRQASNRSFEQAIFGCELRNQQVPGMRLVDGAAFLFVCFAIQFLGFLFTMALLFMPTIIVSLAGLPGLKRHLFLVAGLGGVSTLVGFMASLQVTRLPTVPSIVTVLVIFGLPLALSITRLPRQG